MKRIFREFNFLKALFFSMKPIKLLLNHKNFWIVISKSLVIFKRSFDYDWAGLLCGLPDYVFKNWRYFSRRWWKNPNLQPPNPNSKNGRRNKWKKKEINVILQHKMEKKLFMKRFWESSAGVRKTCILNNMVFFYYCES